MRVAARRKVDADASGAPDADGGVGDFEQQPRTILNSAAVSIRSLVRGVLQELIEQVAVGAVNLHAVEAGDPGVLRASAKGLDDAGDLFEREGVRNGLGLLRP